MPSTISTPAACIRAPPIPSTVASGACAFKALAKFRHASRRRLRPVMIRIRGIRHRTHVRLRFFPIASYGRAAARRTQSTPRLDAPAPAPRRRLPPMTMGGVFDAMAWRNASNPSFSGSSSIGLRGFHKDFRPLIRADLPTQDRRLAGLKIDGQISIALKQDEVSASALSRLGWP